MFPLNMYTYDMDLGSGILDAYGSGYGRGYGYPYAVNPNMNSYVESYSSSPVVNSQPQTDVFISHQKKDNTTDVLLTGGAIAAVGALLIGALLKKSGNAANILRNAASGTHAVPNVVPVHTPSPASPVNHPIVTPAAPVASKPPATPVVNTPPAIPIVNNPPVPPVHTAPTAPVKSTVPPPPAPIKPAPAVPTTPVAKPPVAPVTPAKPVATTPAPAAKPVTPTPALPVQGFSEKEIRALGYKMARRVDGEDLNQDALVYLGRLSGEIGEKFDAHGISKGFGHEQLGQLNSLLTKGIDNTRPFHSAPLTFKKENLAAVVALGAGGPYSTGSFIIVSDKGKPLTSGIKHVIVNDQCYNLISDLENKFPHVNFVRADKLVEYFTNLA